MRGGKERNRERERERDCEMEREIEGEGENEVSEICFRLNLELGSLPNFMRTKFIQNRRKSAHFE